MDNIALILAAGEGKRMHSSKPKVAHEMLGRPLVRWAVEAARDAGCSRVVTVLGHGREVVEPLVADTQVVVQEQQKGTGHAVLCARPFLDQTPGNLVVLSGDSPLICPETIRALMAQRESEDAAAVVLTMCPPDPTGYGRVERDSAGQVLGIVEHKDCTPQQLELQECNSGIYCFDAVQLLSHLSGLTANNAQGEYYLTDVIGMFQREGLRVLARCCDDYTEALGVNSRVQLAQATAIMRERTNLAFMEAGVTMLDPNQVYIGPDVSIAPDVELLPQTFLFGTTSIAEGTVVGPQSRLTNCVVGRDCTLDETVAVDARIENGVNCGPRCYLRPGTHLLDNSKVGTHVEIKNSTVGEGSKVPHLSYMGDATLGSGVNVGAGSITCNYDGYSKFPTTIGNGVFVGSDTMLVAPVQVGENAMIGAGSTITKDVPPGALG